MIYLYHQVFQIHIRPVGENADLVIQGRDYPDHGFKTSVESRMVYAFQRTGGNGFLHKPAISIPE